ncbi:MAG: 2-methoxy-6-polyprenyl-1,4-benzoquinol methylase, partial [uncultured Acetobacteraceae bacterium]
GRTQSRHRRFRLPRSAARGEGADGARRVRQRGPALRPDERPDVARRPPRLEARLRGRDRRRPARHPAGPRRRHRRRGVRRARAGRGPRSALRRQPGDALGRARPRAGPRHRGRRGLLLRRCRAPAAARPLRGEGLHRLRPAQLHGQAGGAARSAARAAPGRALQLPGVQPGRGRGAGAALRRVVVPRAARPRRPCRRRRRQLPLPRRKHPHLPGPGNARRDAARGRLGAGGLAQPVGRHRRRPQRLAFL